MGINKFAQHLIILSEDDAVRQIVVGFLTDIRIDLRRVQALPVSGGWMRVRDQFLSEYADGMRSVHSRHILLAIDCDGDADRIPNLLQQIPREIRDRVFILSSWIDPEALARAVGKSKEKVGRQMAKECAEGSNDLWSHEHLRHNQTEVARLTNTVVPFIFPE